MSFRCPLCRTTVYEQLPATLGGNAALYACAGCSIVFVDPRRLMADPRGVPGQPSVAPDFGRAYKPPRAVRGPARGKRRRTR